jgi:cyclase
LANRYGSQAVIVAIDAKRDGARFAVFARSGQSATARDAVEWAREAECRGAGEILLTSIDRDGTQSGFDLALLRTITDAVDVPVVASGGAGTPEDMVAALVDGHADAVLAASIFHRGTHSIASVKAAIATAGVPVRLVEGAA